MGRLDGVAVGTLLGLAAIALYEAAKLPFGTIRNPGPGFFPWWAGLTLGVLAVLLLGQVLIARRGQGPREGPGRLLQVGGLLAVLGAYVFFLEALGYPLCTFLLVLFMLRVVDPHRWPLALGMAALAAVGSYIVFAVWLKVPLPPGLLLR